MLELKRINESMGIKEYQMYQEIPKNEQGADNIAYGITFKEFKKYLKDEYNKEFSKLNNEKTPTISYICYKNGFPIGDISIRTKINDYWEKHSGNIFYKIRPTERNKGYGTIMLKLALNKCKEFGFKEILIQCNNKNISSKRIIEKNNGILLKEDGYSFFYKIIL
jgi:predicted acetyltransferase